MASLMTSKTMDEVHEAALKDDIERTEAIEEANKNLAAIGKAKEQKPEMQPVQSLRIDVPVDRLLNYSRQERKIFFTKLIKDIKAGLEMIRIERRIGR